jgi:hypothetical protein
LLLKTGRKVSFLAWSKEMWELAGSHIWLRK